MQIVSAVIFMIEVTQQEFYDHSKKKLQTFLRYLSLLEKEGHVMNA